MNNFFKSAFFYTKYSLHYSKPIPQLASHSGNFSSPYFMLAATPGNSPLERARRNLAREQATAPQATEPAPQKPQKPAEKPPKRHNEPKPAEQHNRQQTAAKAPARTPRQTATRPRTAPKRPAKRPPVILATVTGLILSAVVLLAATGLWGAYCFAQGLPGDTNVAASTLMYALAVFVGCFWASAMVKRQSKLPPIIIGVVHLLFSLVISAQLFALADFKPLMILEKLLLTAAAGLAGYALSLIPYLISRAGKNKHHA